MKLFSSFVSHARSCFSFRKIWSRYFLLRFLKLTCLIIVLSYILFVIADMVGHMKDLLDSKTSKKMWISYYIAMFSRRLEILIPFSCGISATLILVKATNDNVITPLLCSGLSIKRFLVPFMTGALIFSCLLWINFEWLYPKALQTHSLIVETDFGRSKLKDKESRLGVILLPKGQRLFFNRYIAKKRLLKDVFWVVSRDKIYHIEEIVYSQEGTPAETHGVELFERTQDGFITKSDQIMEPDTAALSLSEQQIAIATAQPKENSISDLLMISECYGSSKTERANETTIALYTKLLSPLLSLFSVSFAAILCLHFERRYVSLTIPLISIIILLFCMQVVLQASTVLARSPFVPTTFVLILPWIGIAYLTLRQFRKIW